MKFHNQFKSLFFPHDGKTEHFSALDGLRGVAVVMVLLSHSSNASIFFHPYLDFHNVGKIGVYLFFVLSAYLLDRQIAVALRTGKSSLRYWLNYALRRFLRIFPLFAIALFVHYGLTYSGITTVIDSVSEVLLHLALVRGEDVFWSIPVEFKYYIISPFLMYICHRVLKWNLMAVFALLGFLIVLSMAIRVWVDLSLTSTIKFFPVFLVGTAISIYELVRNKDLSRKSRSKLLDIAGLVAICIIFITIPYYFELLFNKSFNFQTTALSPMYALLWGMLLIGSKYGFGLLQSIFKLNVLRFLGTISFSMYLFHMPILILVNEHWLWLPEFSKIYVFFGLTILVSAFNFIFIERPLSKIRINTINSSN